MGEWNQYMIYDVEEKKWLPGLYTLKKIRKELCPYAKALNTYYDDGFLLAGRYKLWPQDESLESRWNRARFAILEDGIPRRKVEEKEISSDKQMNSSDNEKRINMTSKEYNEFSKMWDRTRYAILKPRRRSR